MTRQEAQAFINALLVLRTKAADEQAIDAAAVYPTWREGVAYVTGERVRYNEILYKILQDHTSQTTWTPESAPSLFAKVLISDTETIPEWTQPDSTNPYQTGDKVTYNGATWISTIDNNVWAPGAYGWTKVES